MLVSVICSSEIVVYVVYSVLASCVEIKTVVEAGCRLVMVRYSVEAGKIVVCTCTVVSVPVCVMYSKLVSVEGGSDVVSVRA